MTLHQHSSAVSSDVTVSNPDVTIIPELVQEAIALAEKWQTESNAQLRPEEKAHQRKMSSLLKHPTDKVVFSKMIDQSFRATGTARVANQLTYLLRKFGIPRFFSAFELTGIRLLMVVGSVFHFAMIPFMIFKMRRDSSRVILAGEKGPLYKHLAARKSQGIRLNVNQIGEAMLGERDALERFENYKTFLRDPAIEYISIKITTIYSQIDHVAHEESIQELEGRLAQLYAISQEHEFERPDGTVVKKFINLDMEEYRDLEITYDLFTRTLDRPELKQCSAGIVLQGYLPDSYEYLKKLTAWAKERVANGGAPVKIRIVKGANLEMEKVEASHRVWPLATLRRKVEVDANYKRMLEYAMQPENIKALRLGLASHNIFELAYAFVLSRKNGVQDYFVFEMLEGMALHVTRVIQREQDVLLYAPVTEKEGFINAIGYLIRRLDENTGPENFLRHSFDLTVGDKNWEKLKGIFLESHRLKSQLDVKTYRTQNRLTETHEPRPCVTLDTFVNEPDTDWSLAANREWAQQIREKWMPKAEHPPVQIPMVIAGEEIHHEREIREMIDRSQAPKRVVTAQYRLATREDIDRAVATAKADPDGWRSTSREERNAILLNVSCEMRKSRGDLIGATMVGTGKIIQESDPEVSEGIDFADFYPASLNTFNDLPGHTWAGKGVGVIVPPWNFPVAIPAGGVLAALAAGNTVVMKPSSDAVLTYYELCQCFWRAGVSKNVLQFVPCSGATVGNDLVTHKDVDFVILTGGTETGYAMLKSRPDMFLSAETGGKNATIVTAMSDRDQAIKNILSSAFGNAGQKCSCSSLLLLEREVFEDKKFRATLKDAVESKKAGHAWNFQSKVGPMIHEPRGDLKRGIEQLEPGEFWLVEPKMVDNNPYVWSPGVRWNVQPNSFTHHTELFGPILSVMCYDKLEDAIDIVNGTGFGLTSGIESLDPREQAIWKENIQAGNLYINRGTTGAVVLRQPFGGMGKSGFGMGMKAGGPSYVAQFMTFTETGAPSQGSVTATPLTRLADQWESKLSSGQIAEHRTDLERAVAAIRSYAYNWDQEFSKEHDYFKLYGQDNILRYLSDGITVVRVTAQDTVFETVARIAAAKTAKNTVVVSCAPDAAESVVAFLKGEEGQSLLQQSTMVTQSDAELAAQLPKIKRLRYAAPDRVPADVYEAAAPLGFYIAREPVLTEGRVELLQYVREQSLSIDYHRYGNLGERALTDEDVVFS